MKLLNSHKIQILQSIENHWLNKNDFTFKTVKSQITEWEEVTLVRYNLNDFYFKFDTKSSSFFCIYSPWDELFTWNKFTWNWNISIYTFELWLKYILRENESLIKLKQIGNKEIKIDLVFENENQPFTQDEKKFLKEKISTTKNILINKWVYTSKDIKNINEKLDILINKSNELSKLDWKTYLLGTITSIIMQCAFWPESANLLWNTLQQQFNNKIIW